MTDLLRLACVFALVMVGFAHRPVSAYSAGTETPAYQLAAYQLPDGTYASICFADDHDQIPHSAKGFGCDACRLTGAILVPAPPSVHDLAVTLAADVKIFERRQRLARALYPPSSGPRAPPAASMFS